MNNKKEQALGLRKKGFSLKEISIALDISKSTASLWLKNVRLSDKAITRIEKLREIGRRNAVIAQKEKILVEDNKIIKSVGSYFRGLHFSKQYLKIICSIMYWCEGGKYDNGVVFINSDPVMIKYFLYTLRKSFNLKEKKFKALLHLHKYHNEKKQIRFWSRITRIPSKQFFKTYIKNNTGKVKRKNYPGCISVRYYDKQISKELILIYKKLAENHGGVG